MFHAMVEPGPSAGAHRPAVGVRIAVPPRRSSLGELRALRPPVRPAAIIDSPGAHGRPTRRVQPAIHAGIAAVGTVPGGAISKLRRPVRKLKPGPY